MGPRSNDRGNRNLKFLTFRLGELQWGRDQMIAEIRPLPLIRRGASLLQWGRDQMIAEMDYYGNHCLPAAKLQWGRDQMIAEMYGSAGYGKARSTASMGPRSNDRGNPLLWLSRVVYSPASMGPRSNDRGNRVCRERARIIGLLQWGRDQMIAEIPCVFPVISPAFLPLQWGRDQMIAEMPMRKPVAPLAPAASMGPRSNDRGNERHVTGQKPVAVASMGPRSNDRGNEV